MFHRSTTAVAMCAFLAAMARLPLGAVTAQAQNVAPAAHPLPTPPEIIVGFEAAPSPTCLTDIQRVLPRAVSARRIGHQNARRPDTNSPIAGQAGKGIRRSAAGQAQVRPRQADDPFARVRVVTLQPGQDIEQAARLLARHPGVRYAHPNYLIEPAFLPNDPLFNDGQQYGPQIINAPEAWDITLGDPAVVLAVVDTGLLFIHEEFLGATWTNPGESRRPDGVDNDGNGFVDDFRGWNFMMDSPAVSAADPHGTHVAAIAAANIDNAKGIAGIADCSIMALQVFDRDGSGSLIGTVEALARAFVYAAENGADVINFSGTVVGNPTDLQILQDAVQFAFDRNVPIIAAVGNRLDEPPKFPAAYPETIAVSGTDGNDQRWIVNRLQGSAAGPHVDVAAPGDVILSASSEGLAQYTILSGTSMATAHVSGLVVLMLSVDPTLTIADIRRLLHENAVDLGPAGFDEVFGWGRVDASATVLAAATDDVAPQIIHDAGQTTWPRSGFIDPALESDNGIDLDLGIDRMTVAFTEPVRDLASGESGGLTPAAFELRCGGGLGPQIIAVDASANPTVAVQLDGPLPPGRWCTLICRVEDLAGNPITSLGDLGPDTDEPDRIDVAFLPGDVDQDGRTLPADLIRLRARLAGSLPPPLDVSIELFDLDRDGFVQPLDVLNWGRIARGTTPATRVWLLEAVGPRP